MRHMPQPHEGQMPKSLQTSRLGHCTSCSVVGLIRLFFPHRLGAFIPSPSDFKVPQKLTSALFPGMALGSAVIERRAAWEKRRILS